MFSFVTDYYSWIVDLWTFIQFIKTMTDRSLNSSILYVEDYRSSLRSLSIKPEENLFFAGVYQIVKIESSISNGQFLQTLTCVRLNNQEGLGAGAGIITQAANKFTKAANASENIGENTFVADKIKEELKRKAEDMLGSDLEISP